MYATAYITLIVSIVILVKFRERERVEKFEKKCMQLQGNWLLEWLVTLCLEPCSYDRDQESIGVSVGFFLSNLLFV